MKSSRGSQFFLIAVFLLVLGTFSTGFADKNKVLVQPQKRMVEKISPFTTEVIADKSFPDLSVHSIKIIPTNPTTSDMITITVDIKNIGQLKSQSSLLKIQIDRKFSPLIRVPSLAINQNWKYTKKINIKRQGNFRVAVIINPGKKIAEKNYKNNSQSKSFQIRKAPPSQPPKPGNSSQPVPMPVTKLQPVTPVVQYSVQIIEFEIEKSQNNWKWYSKLKNNGANTVPNYQLQMRAFQVETNGSEHRTGNVRPVPGILPGATTLRMSEVFGARLANVNRLKLEVWDPKKNISLASEIVPFPTSPLPVSAENSAIPKYGMTKSGPLAKITEKKMILDLPENIIRTIKIKNASYTGQGQWAVEIENIGNVSIYQNQISITAIYHVGGSLPLPESNSFKNKTIITPNATEIITGYGLNNSGECGNLWSIDIFAYDSIKDATYTDVINTPAPTANLDNIRLENSILSYKLTNTTPYPIKVKVKIEEIQIWDGGGQSQQSDNAWYEDAWDFMTGEVELDTSGLTSLRLLGSARNIIFNDITLKAAGQIPAWISINKSTLNAMLRAKCPGANFNSYSFHFKNLRMKLYTENINRCNKHGNSTYTGIDTETVTEGGTKTNPAFVW